MILTPRAHALQLESIGCLNADMACGVLFAASHNYDTVSRRTSWAAGWETVDQAVELDAMAYTHIHTANLAKDQRPWIDYDDFANTAIDAYLSRGLHPNYFFVREIAEVCKAYAAAIPEPGGENHADM